MDSITPEIWLPVADWPYAVSNRGRVRRALVSKGTRVGKILRPGLSAGRYSCVHLSRNGKTQTFTVHVLVAAAFIGPRPFGMVVHHKDGNPPNNWAENLEYVTQQRNLKHASETGLQPIGESHPNAKLSAADVGTIRAQIKAGARDGDIAKRFEVRAETIGKIRRGTARKNS